MANPEHVEILKQGVEVWNAWREDNIDVVYPDLSEANRNKANLSDADLSGAELGEAKLNRTNLSHANLFGAYLGGAQLFESNLKEVDLREALLIGANFSRVDLRGANLKRADLREVNLREADLRDVNLSRTDLRKANLEKADLREVNLWEADLRDANLKNTDLRGANFNSAKFKRTSFCFARNGGAFFGNVDLRETKGLEEIDHRGPSTIGMDTIKKSKGKIPEVFLRGCGLSDYEIEIVKLWRKGMDRNEVTDIAYDLVNLYCGDGLQFYSCFISYNNADGTFARKLHDDLQDNGVRCWFAPEDMKIGDRIRPRIDQEIRLRDKLLVILSENSVDSEWVGDEVEAALEEERMDGRTILFPIRLDNDVMETRLDWAAKIRRRRHIGDFTDWQEEGRYQQGFQRLLRDLKATGSK
jgi:uncharacterized protein YjbI with pentapeptide repeats